MTAEALLNEVVCAGGVLRIDGDGVKILLPKSVTHLAEELKQHKPELIALLRAKGGRAANFPRCPACGSYALFREHNIGAYECLTCTLQNISEADARQSKNTELERQAATIRLRAERRGGELLREMPKAKGAQGNPGGQGAKIVRLHDGTAQTLDDLGISKRQSSDWQKLAAIPEEKFRNEVAS
jgi:Zn ribbon nucleic-acid-binding protein